MTRPNPQPRRACRRGAEIVVVVLALSSCAGPADDRRGAALDEIQRSALDDGVVSYDEYLKSYDAVVQCLVDSGHVATLDAGGSDGLLSIVVESPDASAADRADVDYRSCFERLAGTVAVQWASQTTDAARDVTVYERTLTCLERNLGLDLSDVDPASPQQLSAVIESVGETQYGACFRRESSDTATVIETASPG